MEFLGDSIMQLVATEYLFIHFPDHHEGHLTVSISIIWYNSLPCWYRAIQKKYSGAMKILWKGTKTLAVAGNVKKLQIHSGMKQGFKTGNVHHLTRLNIISDVRGNRDWNLHPSTIVFKLYICESCANKLPGLLYYIIQNKSSHFRHWLAIPPRTEGDNTTECVGEWYNQDDEICWVS